MTYKNWKIWLSQLPFSLKWLVILVLLRPIIDLFYFLKEFSPLLSPLYIVGILTPILIVLSFLSKGFPKKYKSIIFDLNFAAWSLIVGFNLMLLFLIQTGFDAIGDVLRYGTPIFLFLYYRNFIRSKVDLIGVLQTFYYSACIPAAMLIYELMFGAISPEYLSESRGGGARIQGGYADIMNYAIYITGAIIIKSYFYLRSNKLNRTSFKKSINLLLVFLVCFIGLISIKQTSSWAVVFALIGLFMFFNLKSVKGLILILLFSPLLFLIGVSTFTDKIEPLIEKEYNVIEGNSDIKSSFNGRMGRWFKYFDIWSEMSIESNLFGTTFSGNKNVPSMLSGGMHNDYVRVIFLSGIIGFILYLAFFILIIKKAFSLPTPEKFLILGAVGSTMLYSVSATPLLYVPFLYYTFPIFAYAVLPSPILLKNEII